MYIAFDKDSARPPLMNASGSEGGGVKSIVRRGASLNSYNFAPTFPPILPLIGGAAAARRIEVNVAPQCRNRQNFLLFHQTSDQSLESRAYEVSSEKFLNYARRSPPPRPLFSATTRNLRNRQLLRQSSCNALLPQPSSPQGSQTQQQQRRYKEQQILQRREMSNVVDERDDNGEGTGETLIVGLPASSTVTQSPPLGGNGGGRHSATSRIRGVTFDGFKRRAAAAVSTVGSIPSSVPIDADENSAVAAVSRHMMMRSSDVATDSSGVEHVLIDDTPGHSQYRERGETKLRCYDVDYDGDTKMPAEKSSLKNSLKIEDAILRLNIGGASYRIRTRSILKYGPNTLLGRFCRMDHEHRRSWADAFFEESDEYFFERVPRYFDPIYDFYAAGKLHVPKDLCFDKFMGELRFWAVSKAKMDDCCSPFAQYCLMRKMPSDQPEKDHFIGLRCAKIRRRLWLILEGHSHSKWWKLFEITSTSFVVLSITALILGSMPEFQVPENTRQSFNFAPVTYPTYPKVDGFTVSTTKVIREGEDHRPEMVEHPVFNVVENICVIYFTFEYLLRFWVAPRKLIFVKEFLNVIDLLAIAPFVFEILLILMGIRGDNVRKVRWAFLTVRLLRVLRVVRIAKLGRFSPGLANFALTLRKSKKQMQMVAIVLLTIVIFFSTLMYFLERDEPNTTFTSIPAAFWWCLFSQTQFVPNTAVGKVFGGGAIMCGMLVLALPIVILVNNFLQVVKVREEKIIKQYAQQHGDRV